MTENCERPKAAISGIDRLAMEIYNGVCNAVGGLYQDGWEVMGDEEIKQTLLEVYAAGLGDKVALEVENARLRGALYEITEPIEAMQKRCQALGGGCVIDGHMAIQLANDPNNLKIIAKKALSETDRAAILASGEG